MSNSTFWKDYYTRLSENLDGDHMPWLDLSNERVQVQVFGLVLESAGEIYRRRCLDVGCGWGRLSLVLQALGAEVVALDITPAMVEQLRRQHANVSWVCGDLTDESVMTRIGQFDLVLAIEVLQYVPFEEGLQALWSVTSPGGRLLGVVPNARCPIVASTMEKFGQDYSAVTSQELDHTLTTLQDLEFKAMRGPLFGDDQRFCPYEVTPWTFDAIPSFQSPANRFMFVAQKKRS